MVIRKYIRKVNFGLCIIRLRTPQNYICKCIPASAKKVFCVVSKIRS